MPAPSRLFCVGLGLALNALAASAATVSLEGLVSNSPFMLPQGEAPAAPVATENATVEFRGLIETNEGTLFGLFDRTKNQGEWVTQNQGDAEFKVSAYDADSSTVTVQYQGQTLTLPLSTTKIADAPPQPLPVVNNNNRTSPNRGIARPAEDRRRLEAVAAEVRRRRALRQSSGAASQSQGQ